MSQIRRLTAAMYISLNMTCGFIKAVSHEGYVLCFPMALKPAKAGHFPHFLVAQRTGIVRDRIGTHLSTCTFSTWRHLLSSDPGWLDLSCDASLLLKDNSKRKYKPLAQILVHSFLVCLYLRNIPKPKQQHRGNQIVHSLSS